MPPLPIVFQFLLLILPSITFLSLSTLYSYSLVAATTTTPVVAVVVAVVVVVVVAVVVAVVGRETSNVFLGTS